MYGGVLIRQRSKITCKLFQTTDSLAYIEIMNRRIGIYHGRPASIPYDAIDAEMPKELPNFWSPGQHTRFSHVTSTLQLYQALGRIAREMYGHS